MHFPSFLLRRKTKCVILVAVATWTLYVLGALTHLMEQNYHLHFTYPYEVADIQKVLFQLHNRESPDTPPINLYNYSFLTNCREKCEDRKQIRLVYVVKSALNHFERRSAIRRTWGYELRFSDVPIRTVFLLGIGDNVSTQLKVENESSTYKDIVQSNFKDSYYNNTIKTMMGFKWAIYFCSNSNFYMFVDDDYYISTRNILRFVRNPTNYPDYVNDKNVYDFELPNDVRLYAGYVFKSSPHRHLFSRWYVSLREYAFHMWPPYVTAGAYILSKTALIDMYHGSLYTKHFRFDDIYLGLIAKKIGVEPFHCEHFHFYKRNAANYNSQFTIASHGYDSPSELLQVWNRQKMLGNA